MEDNNAVIIREGKELPLPPDNPLEQGIVVPVTPEDKKS